MSNLRIDLFRLVKLRLEEEYSKRNKISEGKVQLEDFSAVCRICLSKESLQPISDLYFQGKNLKDLIEFATCVKIEENDQLPLNICLKCYTDVMKASVIKELCRKTDVILKSCLKCKNEIVKEELPVAEEEMIEQEVRDEEYIYEDASDMVEETLEQTEETEEERADDRYFLVFDDIDEFLQSSVEGHENEVSIESSSIEGIADPNDYSQENSEDGNTITLNIGKLDSKSESDRFENRDHTYSRMPKIAMSALIKNKFDAVSDGKGIKTFEGAYIEQIKKTMTEMEDYNADIRYDETYEEEMEMNTEEYDEGNNEYIYIENFDGNEEVVESNENQEGEIFYVTNLDDPQVSEENVEGGEYIISSGFGSEVKNHTNVWFCCKICGKRFVQNSQLKKHIKLHMEEKEFMCELCGKVFVQRDFLMEHMKTHGIKEQNTSGEEGDMKENKQEQNPAELVCTACNVTFATRYEFRSHRTQHHKEKNFLCPTCGKMFASSTSLHTHIKTLHKGEKSTCEICNKTFSSYGNLKLHHSRHHTEEGRPYKCNLCLKAFVTTTDLKFHMQVHSGEKNFICQVCGKGFRLKTSYNSHTLIHTGERPHQCKICLRRFVQPTHLNYHSLTHTGERPHACHYCGKTFALKGNLTVHIRTHTGERPYVCDVCGKGFYDSSSMKKHRKGHHGEDPVIPAVLSIVKEEENNES